MRFNGVVCYYLQKLNLRYELRQPVVKILLHLYNMAKNEKNNLTIFLKRVVYKYVSTDFPKQAKL